MPKEAFVTQLRRITTVMHVWCVLRCMEPICTNKIGTHSSNPSHKYPIIRLPREFRDLIGKTATIYQTEQAGELAFVITIGESVGAICANLEQEETAKRVDALESQIRELKSLLFSKEGSQEHKIRKSKAEGEIRTRVVASTGPLPLPTAQMCHKTSFDLSCRTGQVRNVGIPWLYYDVN